VKPRVVLTGHREAQINLRRIAQALGDDQMREFAIEALQPVADTARSLVSVRSGATRDGITVSARLPDGSEAEYNGRAAFVGTLDTDSRVPWYLELGTVKQRAEPFLIPAVDAEAEHVFDILGGLAGRAITLTAS
jgi:hypothetical protein